ncbi:MAG: hypothetical protein A2V65_09245 [Deltaproteobacteria bacterium RBG_13_49_15]|nr:MAG: hypothetical protein A2V65_09245 [Deltaproteobacteria bacterium RBG_13_49_15]
MEVFSGSQLVQKLRKEKECDITDAVRKAGNWSLRFICLDADKNTHEKFLAVGVYAHLFKPVAKNPCDSSNSIPRASSTGEKACNRQVTSLKS